MLRREDGHIFRRALESEVEGKRKKWMLKKTYEKQVDEESANVGLRRKDVLCRSKCIVDVNHVVSSFSESGHSDLL